jgi:hypothetical protein
MTFIGLLASTTIPDILRDGLSVPTERQGQTEMNRIARILRSNGWVRYQKKERGLRSWRYQKHTRNRQDAPAMAEPKF